MDVGPASDGCPLSLSAQPQPSSFGDRTFLPRHITEHVVWGRGHQFPAGRRLKGADHSVTCSGASDGLRDKPGKQAGPGVHSQRAGRAVQPVSTFYAMGSECQANPFSADSEVLSKRPISGKPTQELEAGGYRNSTWPAAQETREEARPPTLPDLMSRILPDSGQPTRLTVQGCKPKYFILKLRTVELHTFRFSG